MPFQRSFWTPFRRWSPKSSPNSCLNSSPKWPPTCNFVLRNWIQRWVRRWLWRWTRRWYPKWSPKLHFGDHFGDESKDDLQNGENVQRLLIFAVLFCLFLASILKSMLSEVNYWSQDQLACICLAIKLQQKQLNGFMIRLGIKSKQHFLVYIIPFIIATWKWRILKFSPNLFSHFSHAQLIKVTSSVHIIPAFWHVILYL